MKKPKIISLIKINGEVYDQDNIPEDVLAPVLKEVIARAALNIGFEIMEMHKEKTA